MTKIKTLSWLSVLAMATVTLSYAICYTPFAQPQCVSVGSCYSACTPQGCSQSTCLVATQAGYEYNQANVYPSGSQSGTQNRTDTGQKNTCYVSSCKLWNNCTQQYEYSPLNGCSCNYLVTRWVQQAPTCP